MNKQKNRANKTSPRKTSARRLYGSGLVEVAAVSCCMIVLVLLCVDIGVLVYGASLNDKACRDAARAAAQGTSYANALALAQAAMTAYQADGTFLTTPTIDTASFTYQDYGGSPPNNTSPYVSVTTTSNAKIPTPVFFRGASFGASSSYYTFRRTYDFPIVKLQLYLGSGT
jgi:Flp pilus assembly protein TadG